MLALPFPMIDPVLVSFGPFAVRWYALAYVAGILLGWWYVKKLNLRSPSPIPSKPLDDMMLWAILGVILGGRLGYVLFYNPIYFFSHPAEIFQPWHGGMSFHGGLLGVILAFLLFCIRNKLQFFSVMDLAACATPIGLFFGRIANFINGELYGRVSDVPWAVEFPHGGSLPRHPSQLYEAGLEGLALFVLLGWLAMRTRVLHRTGALSGVFLAGYAVSRMIVECFREPDPQLGYIFGSVTIGQLLCIPMLAFGLWLIMRGMGQKMQGGQ